MSCLSCQCSTQPASYKSKMARRLRVFNLTKTDLDTTQTLIQYILPKQTARAEQHRACAILPQIAACEWLQ